MKTSLITTIIFNGKKTITKENLKNDDIRLEMLKDIKNKYSVYSILDCDFDYRCSHTKYGYKVTKTIIQNRLTKEITIQDFNFN